MPSLWSVDSDQGTNLTAEELVDVLAAHHARVLGSWQGFTPEQWQHQSRNPEWSVHETARHVADVMETCAANVLGETPPFTLEGFDPRATPSTWMTESAGESPARTIERFADAAGPMRVRVGEHMAAGEDSTVEGVYGPVHWSVLVVHLLWDSWLHERDVLLPLGLPAGSTIDEQRLAGIYALLMTMVVPKMMNQPFAAAVHFTGPVDRTVVAAHESGNLSSTETETSDTKLVGDLGPLVDSLSGRGATVNDLLPDAPDMLGLFAGFMAG